MVEIVVRESGGSICYHHCIGRAGVYVLVVWKSLWVDWRRGRRERGRGENERERERERGGGGGGGGEVQQIHPGMGN